MILLLLSVCFNDYDFNFSQDKIGHIGIGYTTASITYWGFSVITNNPQNDNIWTSIATSAVIGIWKEGYDLQHTGKASLGDLAYTIIGGTLGAIISNWLFNQGDSK